MKCNISLFGIIDKIYGYAYNIYQNNIKDGDIYNFIYWMWYGKFTETEINKIFRTDRRKSMARKKIFNYVNQRNHVCLDAFEGVDDKLRARQKDFPIWGTGPSTAEIQERDYVCARMISGNVGIFRIERISYINMHRWHGRASWVGYYTIRNLDKYINEEIW